jgi:Ca2+-binding RTX toxin-like protein
MKCFRTAMLLAIFCLCATLTLNAQAQAATCNGVVATIVATIPGPITGTTGADVIVGTSGDDQITGLAGNDLICAGDGNDTINWNPGDGSDTVEGQAGIDSLRFNGSNVSEQIDLSANGLRLRLFRNVANVIIDSDDLEQVTITALGGADAITVNDLAGTDLARIILDLAAANTSTGDSQPDAIVVNGTTGDDTISIAGGVGNATVQGLITTIAISAIDATLDTLVVNGRSGNDTIRATALTTQFNQFLSLVFAGTPTATNLAVQSAPVIAAASPVLALTLIGGPGTDTLLGSPGDDTFIWNPGDGNDSIEGQAGADRLQFNGANVSENIDISANGARVRLFRNIAAVTLDLDDVEAFALHVLGGADTITVNDLGTTDITQMTLNLAAMLGGSGGDSNADSIIVNATNGDDVIVANGSAGNISLTGLPGRIDVQAAEGANDSLRINLLAGDDVIDASALEAGNVILTIDGENGADVLVGSAGNDIIFGGPGDDVLIGGPGLDLLDGGTGDNIIIQD